jgi:hypothetical protein
VSADAGRIGEGDTMKYWVLAAVMMLPGTAFAQSTYVAGAIGAEMLRATTVSAAGVEFDTGSGESFFGALRVGTFLVPRFGVELEFLRPGEIENDRDGRLYLAARDGIPVDPLVGRLGDSGSASLPIIAMRTTVRTTTISALATARQSVGRVDLVYLGGIGFSRVVQAVELGIPRGSFETGTTQHAVGPVVGTEARIGMTEHAWLVTGVRLHALGQGLVDGWLIRPSVGLGWTF